MDSRILVGLNLRRLRTALGLSQEALALVAGVEPSYVGRIERGSENPTVLTLDSFAMALRTSSAAFFEPVKDPSALTTLKPGRKPKSTIRREPN